MDNTEFDGSRVDEASGVGDRPAHEVELEGLTSAKTCDLAY
jgi:hypothetical protein